jgi:hypothetical protein
MQSEAESLVVEATSTGACTTSEVKARRHRTGKKRVRFKNLPRPAVSVRGLWENATSEEKTCAHKTCMTMLALWLGKIDRLAASAELEIPPLRVWQLSQQALSGMLAGLLKQPRRGRRSKEERMATDPEDDPKVLKKEIETLRRRLKLAEDLIAIYRDLPFAKAAKTPPTTSEEGARTPPEGLGEKRGRARRAAKRKPSPSSPRAQESGEMAPGTGTDPAR